MLQEKTLQKLLMHAMQVGIVNLVSIFCKVKLHLKHLRNLSNKRFSTKTSFRSARIFGKFGKTKLFIAKNEAKVRLYFTALFILGDIMYIGIDCGTQGTKAIVLDSVQKSDWSWLRKT